MACGVFRSTSSDGRRAAAGAPAQGQLATPADAARMQAALEGLLALAEGARR